MTPSFTILEETKKAFDSWRKGNVELHELFSEVRSKRLWKEAGYTRLIDWVKAEDLPFGGCFYCGKEIENGSGLYKITCSIKCQKRWFSLKKPRQLDRYVCKSCRKERKPHTNHKSGLCRSCLNKQTLLARRPDIENIGKCLDCGDKISRDAYRCKSCGSYEKWKGKSHLPETVSYRKIKLFHSAKLIHAIKTYLRTGKHREVPYLGCSVPEVVLHLESRFVKGMTWENRGVFGWHIDHIRPTSAFILTNEEDLKKAFHYTNLQPLWALDNIRKNNKIL